MKAVADLGTTPITQAIATQLLPDIRLAQTRRQAELLPQRDAMAHALKTELPEWTWTKPAGGFFFWVRLPFGDAHEFAQVAIRYGVTITPGSSMDVDGTHRDAMRLSYTIDIPSIQDGIKRLAAAWRAYAPHARIANAPEYQPFV
jgi:DNA-binding transcriptional MocR family regulator